MQMFTQRLSLSRQFQSLCSTNSIRAFHNTASPATRTSTASSVLNPVKRTPGAGFFQTRSLSTTTLRSNSFARNASSFGRSGWNSRALSLGGAFAGLGLSFAAYQLQRAPALCDAPTTPPPSNATPTPLHPGGALPPPPRSSVNVYELGFGTVAGICAGVFIKKGAKALAFVFGGVFVLLQYLTSLRIIRVNWAQAESGFQKAFYSHSVDATGKEVHHPPTVYSLFRWIVDFLTADFQPRASFIAGLALGLRLG